MCSGREELVRYDVFLDGAPDDVPSPPIMSEDLVDEVYTQQEKCVGVLQPADDRLHLKRDVSAA
jgi:hypothetical protein